MVKRINTNQPHEMGKSSEIATDNLAERKPSEVKDAYWISTKNETGNYLASTERSGKWLLFINVEDIDEVWAKIKLAIIEGRLGGSAKVATARPNPNELSPRKRVICVYTYDWTDEVDVRRVREELRTLGFMGKIAYKSDEDTLAHKKGSKYYE